VLCDGPELFASPYFIGCQQAVTHKLVTRANFPRELPLPSIAPSISEGKERGAVPAHFPDSSHSGFSFLFATATSVFYVGRELVSLDLIASRHIATPSRHRPSCRSVSAPAAAASAKTILLRALVASEPLLAQTQVRQSPLRPVVFSLFAIVSHHNNSCDHRN
jgi:hypothetical protein